MVNIYKHTVGFTFEISTEVDLTEVTNTALLIKKPSNKTAIWPAVVLGDPMNGILTYQTATGDLDEDGWHFMQSYIEKSGGRVFYGNAIKFKVLESFEVS
jgi:hypothetical protein